MGELESQSAGAMMLGKLRRGLSHYRECCFPGLTDFPIVIVPLSVDALQESYAAAEERFRLLKIEMTVLTAPDFNGEVHIQILARALRDPADSERNRSLFKSADELRQKITEDERILLVDEYIEVQAEANPSPEAMGEELFKEIDAAVKKKDQSKLSSIGSRTLVSYLLSLESQPSS